MSLTGSTIYLPRLTCAVTAGKNAFLTTVYVVLVPFLGWALFKKRPAPRSVPAALLEEKGVALPVFGMVKDEHHKTRTLTDGEHDIGLTKRQDIFVFVYKIQEEVHRFAFSGMDAKRRKSVRKSTLESIQGVGPESARRLNAAFGGLRGVRGATAEQLAAVKGVSRRAAEAVYRHFHPEGTQETQE